MMRLTALFGLLGALGACATSSGAAEQAYVATFGNRAALACQDIYKARMLFEPTDEDKAVAKIWDDEISRRGIEPGPENQLANSLGKLIESVEGNDKASKKDVEVFMSILPSFEECDVFGATNG